MNKIRLSISPTNGQCPEGYVLINEGEDGPKCVRNPFHIQKNQETGKLDYDQKAIDALSRYVKNYVSGIPKDAIRNEDDREGIYNKVFNSYVRSNASSIRLPIVKAYLENNQKELEDIINNATNSWEYEKNNDIKFGDNYEVEEFYQMKDLSKRQKDELAKSVRDKILPYEDAKKELETINARGKFKNIPSEYQWGSKSEPKGDIPIENPKPFGNLMGVMDGKWDPQKEKNTDVSKEPNVNIQNPNIKASNIDEYGISNNKSDFDSAFVKTINQRERSTLDVLPETRIPKIDNEVSNASAKSLESLIPKINIPKFTIANQLGMQKEFGVSSNPFSEAQHIPLKGRKFTDLNSYSIAQNQNDDRYTNLNNYPLLDNEGNVESLDLGSNSILSGNNDDKYTNLNNYSLLDNDLTSNINTNKPTFLQKGKNDYGVSAGNLFENIGPLLAPERKSEDIYSPGGTMKDKDERSPLELLFENIQKDRTKSANINTGLATAGFLGKSLTGLMLGNNKKMWNRLKKSAQLPDVIMAPDVQVDPIKPRKMDINPVLDSYKQATTGALRAGYETGDWGKARSLATQIADKKAEIIASTENQFIKDNIEATKENNKARFVNAEIGMKNTEAQNVRNREQASLNYQLDSDREMGKVKSKMDIVSDLSGLLGMIGQQGNNLSESRSDSILSIMTAAAGMNDPTKTKSFEVPTFNPKEKPGFLDFFGKKKRASTTQKSK